MNKHPKSVNPIPLSELIDAIRDDLIESAKKRPADWQPLFEIGEAVVETTVTFHRDLKVGGKIKVFVAEFGPEAAEQSGASHKLSIKLLPIKASSPPDASSAATMAVTVPATANVLMRGKEGRGRTRRK